LIATCRRGRRLEHLVCSYDGGGENIIDYNPSLDEALKVLKSHPFVGRGGTLQVNEMM